MPRVFPTRAPRAAIAAAIVALPVLAGCVSNTPSAGTSAIDVESSATECKLAATTAPSGTLTFKVKNTGDDVTEFYLLGEDQLRVVSEVENVGPGLTRDLVVQVPAGTYHTACKPGMVGEGIKAAFTVTDSGASIGPSGDVAKQLEDAKDSYIAYVKDQAGTLIAGTRAFADAYAAGDNDTARDLYARTRVNWERIEPVAESFGDLDPLLDAREADLEEGQAWTGWHRIEKDLWPARAKNYEPLDAEGRAKYADDLMENTNTLYDKTRDLTFTADQIANGSRGLLDEVAVGKVTGEEEYWSRTDLWDFQANVDGARVGFDGLRPLLQERDAELDQQIDAKFLALQALLDTHKSGDGFKYYNELTQAEVKALSDAVNALSEPLAKLAAAVA